MKDKSIKFGDLKKFFEDNGLPLGVVHPAVGSVLKAVGFNTVPIGDINRRTSTVTKKDSKNKPITSGNNIPIEKQERTNELFVQPSTSPVVHQGQYSGDTLPYYAVSMNKDAADFSVVKDTVFQTLRTVATKAMRSFSPSDTKGIEGGFDNNIYVLIFPAKAASVVKILQK